MAAETMTLPAVRAVMSKDSRMGTPELNSVDSVRLKRATAILRKIWPMMGNFKVRPSIKRCPLSVLYQAFIEKTKAATTMAISHQKPARNEEIDTTTSVSQGSFSPGPSKPSKMFLKAGMTTIMMIVITMIEMMMTAIG